MTETLYTADEVAIEVGVEVDTVYQWVRRGYLAHAGKRGRRKMFSLDAAFECEKRRQRKHRKS